MSSRGLNPSWIIVAAGISASLHVGKLPPAVPLLQEQLGVSLVQAGFLLSTVQVAGMVLGLAVGLGADKWGLRRSMLTGLLLMAFSSMIGAGATGFGGLLALRALEGLGFLLVAMPAPGLIRRSVKPSDLGARMGWWGSYMPIGSAMGLLLGPWVLDATSWQTWWMVLGSISALAAYVVWRVVPADTAVVAVDATAVAASERWRPRLALTLRSPGPWLVSLGFMVYSGQWMGIVGFLPTLYAEAGLNAKLAGLLTAVVAASNMMGNVMAGKLLNRGWSPARCLQYGYVLMALMALLAYVQLGSEPLFPLWLRFVAVALFSACGGLIPATLFTTAMHLAPSQSTVSTTIGFMQQWSSLGQFMGPPLVAAMAMWMGGWQFTWVVTGCMCAAGWLLAAGVGRCWRRR